MLGLVLNNFYSMQDNIKLSFFISLFLAFISLGLKDPKLISMVIIGQILIPITNTSSSLHIDETSKWNKREITFPIKRRTIITSKYISFALLVVLGIIFSLLTLTILNFNGIKINTLVLINGYIYGLSIAISTISILYPIILKLGANKSDTIFTISIVIAVLIRFLTWIILTFSIKNVNFNGIEVGILNIIFSSILFVLSYVISIYIHKNKSF